MSNRSLRACALKWVSRCCGITIQRELPPPSPPNAPPSAANLVPLTARIHPTLNALPVYVRAGTILPMQPLVQSTGETPRGPLTLRVYAGSHCGGSLYTDDGRSFAYERGVFLRIHFGCTVTAKGIRIAISKHEGSFVPWWKELRLEVYGWKPSRNVVLEDGRKVSASIQHGQAFVAVTVPDAAAGTAIEIE
ncbi:MAG TPA: DUF5110 domain-containing protein [Terracidiphilus sp.]|nr:DUF5110 domain-containing protein [Terracidiphilus sp.]